MLLGCRSVASPWVCQSMSTFFDPSVHTVSMGLLLLALTTNRAIGRYERGSWHRYERSKDATNGAPGLTTRASPYYYVGEKMERKNTMQAQATTERSTTETQSISFIFAAALGNPVKSICGDVHVPKKKESMPVPTVWLTDVTQQKNQSKSSLQTSHPLLSGHRRLVAGH